LSANTTAQLKETLEATKQATKTAIKKGVLTPAKSRPLVRKNLFSQKFREEEEEEEEEERGRRERGTRYEDDDEEEDYDDEDEGYDSFGSGEDHSSYDDLEESYDDLGESYDDLGESLEESYEDDPDDTFVVRRAEAKMEGGGVAAESKSLYHRRAEAKAGGAHITTPRVLIGDDGGGEDGDYGEDIGEEIHSPDGKGGRGGAEYKELADAVSPSARIDDRVDALRRRCEEGLGPEIFGEAYRFLQKLQQRNSRKQGGEGGDFTSPGGTHMERGGEEDFSDDDFFDDDDELEESGDHDEERVLRQLTNILGEENLHFWSLVDQLLFCEDLKDENRRLKQEFD
jgi:hypothetical protein